MCRSVRQPTATALIIGYGTLQGKLKDLLYLCAKLAGSASVGPGWEGMREARHPPRSTDGRRTVVRPLGTRHASVSHFFVLHPRLSSVLHFIPNLRLIPHQLTGGKRASSPSIEFFFGSNKGGRQAWSLFSVLLKVREHEVAHSQVVNHQEHAPSHLMSWSSIR